MISIDHSYPSRFEPLSQTSCFWLTEIKHRFMFKYHESYKFWWNLALCVCVCLSVCLSVVSPAPTCTVIKAASSFHRHDVVLLSFCRYMANHRGKQQMQNEFNLLKFLLNHQNARYIWIHCDKCITSFIYVFSSDLSKLPTGKK